MSLQVFALTADRGEAIAEPYAARKTTASSPGGQILSKIHQRKKLLKIRAFKSSVRCSPRSPRAPASPVFRDKAHDLALPLVGPVVPSAVSRRISAHPLSATT